MADTANQTRVRPGRLRVSDADRDRVAHELSDALIDGRLSHEDHADRIEAAYSAKTVEELTALTHDLPTGDPIGFPGRSVRAPGTAACPSDQALLETSTGSENIVTVLGAAERNGRWLVEPRTNASALFGSIELDLREAMLTRQEVTVQCALFCAGLRLVVTHGVHVIVDSPCLRSSVQLGVHDDPGNGAPTVHLAGVAIMSSVEVTTRAT